jgi:hypothetical protein
LQRRFTELSRFNIFLPPVGRFNLPGPEGWRVPSHIEGLYVVLLRIEAVSDANPAALVAGGATGGVAGFPMPVLRYYVGGSTGLAATATPGSDTLRPADHARLAVGQSVEFNWKPVDGAAFYRLDIEDAQSQNVFSAILPGGITQYQAPPWLGDKATGGILHWRITVFDALRNPLSPTPKRALHFVSRP